MQLFQRLSDVDALIGMYPANEDSSNTMSYVFHKALDILFPYLLQEKKLLLDIAGYLIIFISNGQVGTIFLLNDFYKFLFIC